MFKGFIEPYPIHLVFGDQIISPKVKEETERSCPMHRSLHRSHIKQAITSCSGFRKFCRVPVPAIYYGRANVNIC